jgi:hypothetical protein
LDTILIDAGVDLPALELAHTAIVTAAYLDTGALPGENAAISALIAAGASDVWDSLSSVVLAWADFRADVFLRIAQRAAEAGGQP